MTEIKKTLTILKARWPEVFLLLGLNVLALALARTPGRAKPATATFTLISLLTPLVFGIIASLLRFGFLRTVYLYGQTSQLPVTLLKTGVRFFWRMVALGLLCILCVLPVFLLATVLRGEQSELWIHQLSFTTAILLLMKFVLLLPAVIIVLDCSLPEGFKSLKNYKLLDAKELVLLFIIQMLLSFVWSALIASNDSHTLRIISSAINQFISLIISVTAVRFVASPYLVYDNGSNSLNLEERKEKRF